MRAMALMWSRYTWMFLKFLYIGNTWQNSVKFIKKLEWTISIAVQIWEVAELNTYTQDAEYIHCVKGPNVYSTWRNSISGKMMKTWRLTNKRSLNAWLMVVLGSRETGSKFISPEISKYASETLFHMTWFYFFRRYSADQMWWSLRLAVLTSCVRSTHFDSLH